MHNLTYLKGDDECHVKGKTLEVGPEVFHMTLDIKLPNLEEIKQWDHGTIEFQSENAE